MRGQHDAPGGEGAGLQNFQNSYTEWEPTDGGRGDAGSGGALSSSRDVTCAQRGINVHNVHRPHFQQQNRNDSPSQQGGDKALLTKAWMAVRGLVPLEEDGVPVLPLHQLAPPHSAAT